MRAARRPSVCRCNTVFIRISSLHCLFLLVLVVSCASRTARSPALARTKGDESFLNGRDAQPAYGRGWPSTLYCDSVSHDVSTLAPGLFQLVAQGSAFRFAWVLCINAPTSDKPDQLFRRGSLIVAGGSFRGMNRSQNQGSREARGARTFQTGHMEIHSFPLGLRSQGKSAQSSRLYLPAGEGKLSQTLFPIGGLLGPVAGLIKVYDPL